LSFLAVMMLCYLANVDPNPCCFRSCVLDACQLHGVLASISMTSATADTVAALADTCLAAHLVALQNRTPTARYWAAHLACQTERTFLASRTLGSTRCACRRTETSFCDTVGHLYHSRPPGRTRSWPLAQLAASHCHSIHSRPAWPVLQHPWPCHHWIRTTQLVADPLAALHCATQLIAGH
jgi:hypothetical protein